MLSSISEKIQIPSYGCRVQKKGERPVHPKQWLARAAESLVIFLSFQKEKCYFQLLTGIL